MILHQQHDLMIIIIGKGLSNARTQFSNYMNQYSKLNDLMAHQEHSVIYFAAL